MSYLLTSINEGELALLGQYRQQQYYTTRLDQNSGPVIEGMKKRGSAFESGLGYKQTSDWGKIELESYFDISGVHKGYEINLGYSYPKQTGRWLIEPGVGVQYQDARLVDYYHGVRLSESQADRQEYRGQQSLNNITSLTLGYYLYERWLAVALIERLGLDKGITDSPIIEKNQLLKSYLGFVYTF